MGKNEEQKNKEPEKVYKQFYKVDDSGQIVDTVLIDINKEIPENHFRGWSGSMYKPMYDFASGEWKEAEELSTILMKEKETKENIFNKTCQDEILAGFDMDIDGTTYHFSYDIEAQINFGDARSLLNDGVITETRWTVRNVIEDEDGERKLGKHTRITVDKPLMQQITLAISQHKNGNISKLRDELIPQVEQAQNLEELRAIQWQ